MLNRDERAVHGFQGLYPKRFKLPKQEKNPQDMQPKQIVVTLTSIPPRYANLPRKLASLKRQSIRPDKVELHIPKTYRRFPGERPQLPPLPDWVDVIEAEFDYGPATKVLPAAKRWRGTPTDLLICDDDRLQDRDWVARFVKGRKSRPADILCERGWNIVDQFGIQQSDPDLPRAELEPRQGRTLTYRLKRLASLLLWHPPRKLYASAGYVDVFEGFLGALAPADAFPEKAYSIPDIVWTVDDVWLSGMAYSNGVKTWVNAMPRPVYARGKYDRMAALVAHVEQDYGRTEANRYAVELLRSHYGVWL